MKEPVRFCIRLVISAAFVLSLYGGVALLTTLAFARGNIVLGVITGLILVTITAAALGLAGLAWSMAQMDEEETDGLGIAPSLGGIGQEPLVSRDLLKDHMKKISHDAASIRGHDVQGIPA